MIYQKAVLLPVQGSLLVPQSGAGSLNVEEKKEEKTPSEVTKSGIFAEMHSFLMREETGEEKAPSEWSESGTIFAEIELFLLGKDDETKEEMIEENDPSDWSESSIFSEIESFQMTDDDWNYFDIEPKKEKAHGEWSDVATNCVLDAAIKLKKQKFHDDWQQIAHEVMTGSGEARTATQCKVKLKNLSQKYVSECEDCALHNRPSKWQFFEKVESLVKIMRKETPEKCEWSKETTEALLKAHQRQSKERKKDGNSRLSSHDWKVIVDEVNDSEITGMLKTNRQCRDRLHTLSRKRHKSS